ncbi:MAG: SDR family NAD(P)-dependent oxidoreductase [Actinomycetota bacterium]
MSPAAVEPPIAGGAASTAHPAVAIVTGAARGIGAATARRLADDGLHVAVLDLDGTAAEATGDSTASSRRDRHAADVTDVNAVTDAVGRVRRDLGPPTVLVAERAQQQARRPEPLRACLRRVGVSAPCGRGSGPSWTGGSA